MLFAKIETHFKWREQFFNWNSMCFSLTDFFLFEWGPTREFFTHKETSPLPEKGYKFWRMLGTNDHLSVRFFNLSLLLWHGASIYNCHLRGPVTLTPNAEFLAVWQFGSGAVTTCFYDLDLWRLGFEHPTFRLRAQRSYPLRHRSGSLTDKCSIT